MKTKLITSLRVAANALANGFPYEWSRRNRCNCGVVACAILGKSPSQINALLPAPDAGEGVNLSWSALAGYYCPTTGIPQMEIFKMLYEAGMGTEDLCNLEYLRDPRVLARCDFGTKVVGHLWWKKKVPQEKDFTEVSHVIRYLRAWADLLTEEGKDDVAVQQKEKVAA